MQLDPRFREFAKQHGPYTEVRPGSDEVVFESGARARRLWDGQHHLEDPPSSPTDLLRSQREYLAITLQREETEFNSAKKYFAESAAMAQQYRNLPPPNSQAVCDELRTRQARVLELRERIKVIDEQLSDTQDAERQRRLIAEATARHSEINRHVADLQSIDI